MKDRFARLIAVDAGQLLLTIEPDELIGKACELHIRMQQNGVTVTHKLSFRDKPRAFMEMDRANEEHARNLYQSLAFMNGSPSDGAVAAQPFAKLIDTEAGQLLLTIEPDEKVEGSYELHVRMQQDGETVKHKLPFPDRERALLEMDRVDEIRALSLYRRIQWLLDNQAEDKFLKGLHWQHGDDGTMFASFVAGSKDEKLVIVEKLRGGGHQYVISNGGNAQTYEEYIQTKSYIQFELALLEIYVMNYEDYVMTF